MEKTERSAIEEILQGNIDKFEVLVNSYSPKILAFVTARLFDKSEADDIVQNSFIQLYKALPHFDRDKPVYPYLLQIARNELFMYFRKKHTTMSLDDDIMRLHSEDTPQAEDINEITQGLQTDNKRALLWFAEGYTYKEIARRMGKPLNTVRTIIRRARLYIKKKYPHGK